MSGWVILLLLFAAALALLRLLGIRGPLLMLSAAALLFGCAGYVVQGRPSLPGSARQEREAKVAAPVAAIRHAFFGNFSSTEHWLLMSESFAERGNTEYAVGVLNAAVRQHPNDPQLWVGLGNALVEHAGVLTPASEFAYQRAAELAPGHPAPVFFMGLALARSGDREGGVALWKNLLDRAPAEASWKPMVESAVEAVRSPARAR